MEDRKYRQFDAQLFGISPTEARVLDPWVRLPLETVYEAANANGRFIDSLWGSDIAAYAGIIISGYANNHDP